MKIEIIRLYKQGEVEDGLLPGKIIAPPSHSSRQPRIIIININIPFTFFVYFFGIFMNIYEEKKCETWWRFKSQCLKGLRTYFTVLYLQKINEISPNVLHVFFSFLLLFRLIFLITKVNRFESLNKYGFCIALFSPSVNFSLMINRLKLLDFCLVMHQG